MALTLRSSSCLLNASKSSVPVRNPSRLALRLPSRKVVTIRASAEPTEPTSNPMSESVEKARAVATEAWNWMKVKWATTEDREKPAVLVILVGVIVAQIAIGATIDVVDRIPVVNKLLQLLGLGVTSVFIYKLVVDPTERDSVKTSVSGFLEKVTGGDE